MNKIAEVFLVALKLGCISFGGPVAHIGFFREEYVEKRAWLSEERFSELMAVTQFLPGPGSSQLGAAVGFERARWLGGIAAWVGFTLPTAIVLVLFAIGVGFFPPEQMLWIKGLILAALGVVLNAVLGMHKKLAQDLKSNGIAILCFVALYFYYVTWMQPVAILVGGLLGWVLFRSEGEEEKIEKQSGKKSYLLAIAMLVIVAVIPFALQGSKDLEITGGIFKAGSLVFGGGHVVLPMLSAEVVDKGAISASHFGAGYGMTQAMPGPVFSFAGYLGAKMELFGNAVWGGGIGLIAVFLPGMLLMLGCVPVWDRLKGKIWARAALRGANAAVVGLLAAAVVKLLVQGDLELWWEWGIVLGCLGILKYKLIPVSILVILMGGVGYLIYQL